MNNLTNSSSEDSSVFLGLNKKNDAPILTMKTTYPTPSKDFNDWINHIRREVEEFNNLKTKKK